MTCTEEERVGACSAVEAIVREFQPGKLILPEAQGKGLWSVREPAPHCGGPDQFQANLAYLARGRSERFIGHRNSRKCVNIGAPTYLRVWRHRH